MNKPAHKIERPDLPKVSIITPVLNARDSIARTIQSIVSQSFADLEYIIIDGGSTDGTIEFINKYSNHISKFISEPDLGISNAFNKGINLSEGELIGIVNSDDWLEPEIIKKIMDVYYSESPDVICGTVKFWADKEEIIESYPDIKKLNIETSVHHAGVFIKKSAYKKYGLYDELYNYAMDYELLLRFKMNGARFVTIDSIVANRSLGGISYKNRNKALIETMRVRRNYFSRTNTILVFLYVYFKDLAGRIVKHRPWYFFYRYYWNRRNRKIAGRSLN